MPQPNIYRVNHLNGSTYKLIVQSIDFELRLYNKNGLFFSVNRNTLTEVIQNNHFPRLHLNRKYLLRYNNNDGGAGRLNFTIIQFIPNRHPIVVEQYNINSIIGPNVIEIPFGIIKNNN